MPQLFLPTTETLINVTRPIVYGIIRDLFDVTGIPVDTMISFPGELEVMQQPGSDIGKISQQAGVNTLAYSNRIFIEVDEDYEMDRILSTAVYRTENPFILIDEDTEVGIRPIYSSTDTTINFKFRSTDKVAAMRWRDYIKTRVSMNWDQRIHKVDYHYLIPIEYLIILKEIHRLIELVDGYGEDFNQYLLRCFSRRATVMTTQAGTQAAWAIVESQVRIVGSFDFDLIPEKGARDDESDTWTVAFAYKYKYDKPTACTMKYPLMIHNQLLSLQYRNNPLIDRQDPLEGKKFGFSFSSWLFYQFESDTQIKRSWEINGWKGIAIPYYDEFIPKQIVPDTVRVVTALISIDPLNPALLLSLKQLGKFKIHQAVLTYLAGEYQYMTQIGMSPFHLSMYRGSKLLDRDSVTLDADLNIYSTYTLTKRRYYHLRLSLIEDFTMLSAPALTRLREHGEAARIIMDYIDPTLKKKNALPKILGNDYITREAMLTAINVMRNITSRDPTMFTVQSLIIEAESINVLKD